MTPPAPWGVQDRVGRFLYVGDTVACRCQGRAFFGPIIEVSEAWIWVEHKPVKIRPSKPRTHPVRVRPWTVMLAVPNRTS